MPFFQRICTVFFLLLVLGGCASLPGEINHTKTPPLAPTDSTLSEISKAYQPDLPGEASSGVLLQDSGWDALAQRVALIESAEHTIDIQYYIWNSDLSGSFLASRLVAAAERGVRVRVLLDDINLNEREGILTALDAHPQIEIRVFNPIPARRGFTKWFSFLGDFNRLNRRMHNKSFTVDGAASVVGGRNIGDEYFDLSDEVNFRDRDVLVAGEVVSEIQKSFAGYWDSRWAFPVGMLTDAAVADLPDTTEAAIPQYKDYPSLPLGTTAANLFIERQVNKMVWVKAGFVYDQPVPSDADNTSEPKATARFLSDLILQSEKEVTIESAYLIFDDRQLEEAKMLTENGTRIKALTNSMASNDLITNHSGYAGRREDMLDNGIQLFELKPDTGLCVQSTRDVSKCAPETAYGLHAKSVVFDRKVAVIGSFNFNLRSTYLNTESILVIENQSFAETLSEDITQAMGDENSWRLNLNDGQVHWNSGSTSLDTEPDTGKWERIQSGFLQLLPIEKYL